VSERTRVRNVRGEGARLRSELVAAASRLLESGDPAAVTLRGVAREAGVAAPSVYDHFDDLDELLRAVVAHHLGQLRAVVETASATGSGPQRFRDGCLAYCRWGVEHPGAYAAVFGGRVLQLLSPDEQSAFADGEVLLGHLRDLLAALPEDGPLATEAVAIDEQVLATWTVLHGVVSLRTGKPGYPWPPLGRHLDLALGLGTTSRTTAAEVHA
jgi:AcrR family transcriptional regulator